MPLRTAIAHAGALIDRGNRLQIVRVTQAVFLAQAFVLWLVTYTGHVNIPLLLGLTMSYALSPLVDRLQRLRLPRALGAALLLGGFLSLSPETVAAHRVALSRTPRVAARVRTPFSSVSAQERPSTFGSTRYEGFAPGGRFFRTRSSQARMSACQNSGERPILSLGPAMPALLTSRVMVPSSPLALLKAALTEA